MPGTIPDMGRPFPRFKRPANAERPAERNAPGGGPRQPRPFGSKRGRAGQGADCHLRGKTGSLLPL